MYVRMDEVCGTHTSVLVQCVLIARQGCGVKQATSLSHLSASYVSTWWIVLTSRPLLVS